MIKYFTGQELRWIDIQVILGCSLHFCKSFFQQAFIISFYSHVDKLYNHTVLLLEILDLWQIFLCIALYLVAEQASWIKLRREVVKIQRQTEKKEKKQKLRRIFFLSQSPLLCMLTLSPTVADRGWRGGLGYLTDCSLNILPQCSWETVVICLSKRKQLGHSL